MKPSHKNISILLIILLVLISTLFLVEGKVDTDKPYKLSLVATHRFSTITLTAHLTHTEDHKEKDVAGAIIHFYTCNSKGGDRREIGHNRTGCDGTATWHWSAPGNGDYWFIAAYYREDNNKDMVTS